MHRVLLGVSSRMFSSLDAAVGCQFAFCPAVHAESQMGARTDSVARGHARAQLVTQAFSPNAVLAPQDLEVPNVGFGALLRPQPGEKFEEVSKQ